MLILEDFGKLQGPLDGSGGGPWTDLRISNSKSLATNRAKLKSTAHLRILKPNVFNLPVNAEVTFYHFASRK